MGALKLGNEFAKEHDVDGLDWTSPYPGQTDRSANTEPMSL